MDSDQTQYTLLGHFDRPKTADLRELAWAEVEDTKCAAPLVAHCARPQPPAVTRGISWVLLWAMAFAVLAIAASVLVEFSYVLVGEHSLRLAARAGATEATLPRATYQSIAAAIERRLTSYPQLVGQLQLTVLQNGRPVGTRFRVGDGDHVSIALTAPTSMVIPGWLQKFSLWRSDAPLSAYAERQAPGRKLKSSRI